MKTMRWQVLIIIALLFAFMFLGCVPASAETSGTKAETIIINPLSVPKKIYVGSSYKVELEYTSDNKDGIFYAEFWEEGYISDKWTTIYHCEKYHITKNEVWHKTFCDQNNMTKLRIKYVISDNDSNQAEWVSEEIPVIELPFSFQSDEIDLSIGQTTVCYSHEKIGTKSDFCPLMVSSDANVARASCSCSSSTVDNINKLYYDFIFKITAVSEGKTKVSILDSANNVIDSINVIVYATNAEVSIDADHFPDDNFRSYVLENLDTDKDVALSEQEINNVTNLDVSGMNISSLEGVEHFISLTELNCSSNQLTSLDVSKLTNLTSLWCGTNQLASLDVSKLTNLTSLWCYENQLTSLDVSKLTNLTILFCRSNQLTSLDVSKLTNLTSLVCGTNQLASLDVSKLTNLTELFCDNNQLTSLDVGNLTNLQILYCPSNQLTSLDVGKLTNLTDLYCSSNQLTSLDVGNLTNLTVLYCSNNQLTSLDVGNLTKLKELYCSNNQLTSLDVAKLTNLKELYCFENQLTSLDVGNLTNLTVLYCYDNQLTSLDVGNLTNLQALSCDNNIFAVTADDGQFDLSTLPGFDVSRASGWQGGTVSGTVLTVPASGDVTYVYDLGNGHTETFTLKVTFSESGHITHTLITHAKVDSTCTETGTEAYWQCEVCKKYFSDAEGKNEIEAPIVIAKKAHTLTAHAKVDSTCTETGTEAYWSCDVCKKLFSDAEGKNEIKEPSVIAAKGHKLTAHTKLEATCTETGTEAYWSCDVCKKFFSDYEGKTEIEAPIIIAAKGHDWNNPEYIWSAGYHSVEAKRICKHDPDHVETETVLSELVVASPTNETPGTATYSASFENKAFEKQTKEVTIPALNKLSVMKLPSAIKTIEENAFTNLPCQAIIIPDGCTAIGEKAFSGCKNLLYIRIPASVKDYPDNAFEGCNENLVIDWVKK